MKIKFKLLSIVTLVALFSSMSSTKAIEMTDTENFKLYEVKEKKEVLVKNVEVLKFFETNFEVLNNLIEEKKAEEKRIEEERIKQEEEQRRLEEERIRQEQERLRWEEEQRRLAEERRRAYEASVVNDGSLGSQIAQFASQFVGNPYVYGGTSLTNGADCSGFVMSVYANFGIGLPRTTYEQSISGYGVSIDQMLPGDIVSYGYGGSATHSAIYVGNGTIVHAATPAQGIMFSNLYMMPIVAVRRIV